MRYDDFDLDNIRDDFDEDLMNKAELSEFGDEIPFAEIDKVQNRRMKKQNKSKARPKAKSHFRDHGGREKSIKRERKQRRIANDFEF